MTGSWHSIFRRRSRAVSNRSRVGVEACYVAGRAVAFTIPTRGGGSQSELSSTTNSRIDRRIARNRGAVVSFSPPAVAGPITGGGSLTHSVPDARCRVRFIPLRKAQP